MTNKETGKELNHKSLSMRCMSIFMAATLTLSSVPVLAYADETSEDDMQATATELVAESEATSTTASETPQEKTAEPTQETSPAPSSKETATPVPAASEEVAQASPAPAPLAEGTWIVPVGYDIQLDGYLQGVPFEKATELFKDKAIVTVKNGKMSVKLTASPTADNYITSFKHCTNYSVDYMNELATDKLADTDQDGYGDTVTFETDFPEGEYVCLVMTNPAFNDQQDNWNAIALTFDFERAEKYTDQGQSGVVDKSALQSAYDNACAILNDKDECAKYTTKSSQALRVAAIKAMVYLENPDLTKAQVEELTAEIDNARKALVLRGDKTELASAIKTAEAIEQGKRTDEAWAALQDAIAAAKAINDNIDATEADVAKAVESLNSAVDTFNSSATPSELDRINLADGIYSIDVAIMHTNRKQPSMANNAIEHTVKLEVVNGEYFVTFDLKGISIGTSFGYLKSLAYYEDGYTFNQYGIPQGQRIDAQILSTQKDSDGNDLIDIYNKEDGSLYPDLVKIKLAKTAITDEEGYAALHVFVPIMEAIATGNGDQDALLKVDWSTLKIAEEGQFPEPVAPEESDNTSEVVIADENLRAAIRSALKLNDDVVITEKKLASLTELKAENAGITDLSGLEYAANLQTLDLSGNDLSQAFVNFGNTLQNTNKSMQNLINVDLSNCQIGANEPDLSIVMQYFFGAATNLESIDLSSNGLAGEVAFKASTNFKGSFDKLKSVNLSNNDLYGVSFPSSWTLTGMSEAGINLSSNRVYANENTGGWYENAVSIGIEKYNFSDQKCLTDIKDVKLSGGKFTTEGIDNENHVIVLEDTFNSSINLCLRGYGNAQTLSAINDTMSLPVMVAAPGVSSESYLTLNLQPGENSIPLTITHVNGESVTYTIKVKVSELPSTVPEGEESAGITEVDMQKAIIKALNDLDEYRENPLDPLTHTVTKSEMAKLTIIDIGGDISDISPLQYATNVDYLRVNVKPGSELALDFSNWQNLSQTCAFVVQNGGTFKIKEIKGLDKATKLPSLSLYADLDDAAMDELAKASSLTNISLHGSCSKSLDLSNLASLTEIEIPLANDGSLPDFSQRQNLTNIKIQGCGEGASLDLSNNPQVSFVGFYEANGDLKVTTDESTTPLQLIVRGAAESQVTLDLDGISRTKTSSLNAQSTGASGSIIFKGNAQSYSELEVSEMASVSFDDSFSAEHLEKITTQTPFVKLPQASAVPTLKELNVWSATDLTEWPTEINSMTSLAELSVEYAPFKNYDALDLTRLENLSVLKLGGTTAIGGTFDVEKLPSSLQNLSLSNTSISRIVGEKQFPTLMMLNLKANRLVEFPSNLISNMPFALMLTLDENLYTEIPENAFDNNSMLYTCTVGNWIPVVEVDGKWKPDPTTSTGKACAKKNGDGEDAITVCVGAEGALGITSGTYSGLTGISSENGTVIGDVFTERTIRVMTSPDQKTVSLDLTPLLSDTAITVNGNPYTVGETVNIDLTGLTTNVSVECSNPYTNHLGYDTTTTYNVQIIAGEYMDKFIPEEGHYYNINYSLKKIDGSFSMADSYFTNIAQVKYVNGRYEIRYSSTSADLINGMRYNADGIEQDADVVEQNGNTITYRIYADSLENKIDITPRVAPMGNVYTTCYMELDLTKAMDVTASVGVDTADLNAAINKALEITEKNNVYTVESWSALLAALEQAQTIAGAALPSQVEVDNAQHDLTKAIDGLEVDKGKLADKLALRTAIDNAKAIEKGNHTDTAWNALQEAIDDAEGIFNTLEARQSEVDASVRSLNTAVTLFNSSGEASMLDKNNLADGIYSISADMIKTDRVSKSMADNAISHTAKLEVKDGEYFITLDFRGITIENRFGYLKDLSYYADGYTYGNYGTIEGDLVAAEVLSTQKDSDGNDVIDQYNDANSLYPDLVRIKLAPQAIADADGYVPLHVFVPIMEAIAAGNGDQDVLMKLDWSTLKTASVDDPDFKPEDPVQQSPAVDMTDSATGVKVHADKGVFAEGTNIAVSAITSGSEHETATKALSDVGTKFNFYKLQASDVDGNEVAPNGPVTISLPIPSGYDASKLALYRINADSSKTLIQGKAENGFYTFTTRTMANFALAQKASATELGSNKVNTNVADGKNAISAGNGSRASLAAFAGGSGTLSPVGTGSLTPIDEEEGFIAEDENPLASSLDELSAANKTAEVSSIWSSILPAIGAILSLGLIGFILAAVFRRNKRSE